MKYVALEWFDFGMGIIKKGDEVVKMVDDERTEYPDDIIKSLLEAGLIAPMAEEPKKGKKA